MVPGELPRFLPHACRDERDARQGARNLLHVAKLPKGTRVWCDEFEGDRWPDLNGSEVDKLVKLLRELQVPHRLTGQKTFSILLGASELRFDELGSYVGTNWIDERGEYNHEFRGEHV